jgi:hypothetical protein
MLDSGGYSRLPEEREEMAAKDATEEVEKAPRGAGAA